MAVSKRGNRWRFRRVVTLRDGTKTRVSGLADTKRDAEWAETLAVASVLAHGPRMGRPPASDEARTLHVDVRVSERELDSWRAYAEQHGFESVSDAVRAAMSKLVEMGR